MSLSVPIIALVAAAAAAPSPADENAYRACVAEAKAEPARAVARANDWLLKGGGVFARQCLGLALSEQQQWPAAADAFEQAAREASGRKEAQAADFWVQAGNAWLAGNNPAKAKAALDAALAANTLSPALQGEAHLDRGRAAVALNDLAGGRADIDQALKLVPADPTAWYLSSALALRQGQLAKAQDDIAEGLKRAPEDPDLLVHAGNIAGLSGERDAARGLYTKAINAAPASDAARRARAALAANRAGPEAKTR